MLKSHIEDLPFPMNHAAEKAVDAVMAKMKAEHKKPQVVMDEDGNPVEKPKKCPLTEGISNMCVRGTSRAISRG